MATRLLARGRLRVYFPLAESSGLPCEEGPLPLSVCKPYCRGHLDEEERILTELSL